MMLENTASRACLTVMSFTRRIDARSAAKTSETSRANQWSKFGMFGKGGTLIARAWLKHKSAWDAKLSGSGVVFTLLTRQPIGFKSTPTLGCPADCASTNVVPQPQKGSKMTVSGGGGSSRIIARGISGMNFAG